MRNFKRIYTKKYWKRKELKEKYFLKLYNLLNKVHDSSSLKKNISFFNNIIRLSSKTIIISLIIFSIIFVLEKFLYYINITFINYLKNLVTIDSAIFKNLLFALLSVAGIFLGLFYSNVSSVYSSNYAYAPEKIRNQFLSDNHLDKYVSVLIIFIINILLMLLANLLSFSIGFLFIILTVSLSCYLVIAFPIIGKAAYRMANYNTIMSPLYKDILITYEKCTVENRYYKNKHIQHHYKKICQNKFETITTLLKFYKEHDEIKSDIIMEILIHNLMLIANYSKSKYKIPLTSHWFPKTSAYKKWVHTSDHEITTALNTGTFIGPETHKENNWFENALLKENIDMLKFFFRNNQLQNIIDYLTVYTSFDDVLFSNQNFSYEYNHLKILYELINNILDSNNIDLNDIEKWSAICDMINYASIGYILNVRRYIEGINIKELISFLKKSSFKEKDIYNNKLAYLNNEKIILFFESLNNEAQIEGKKITPDWFVLQFIIRELIEIINQSITCCIDVYKELVIGGTNSLHEKNLAQLSISGHTREVEAYNKIEVLLDLTQKLYDELEQYNIEKSYEFNMLDLKEIYNQIKKDHLEQPRKWCECCMQLIDTPHETEQPDFIGFAYYNYCELMINSLCAMDEEFFLSNLKQFWELILLADTDITKTMLKEKKGILSAEDNSSWADLTILSQAIFDFMEVMGYAIILGEFLNSDFTKKVKKFTNKTFENLKKVNVNAIKRMSSIGNIRKTRGIAIYRRDLIYSSWKQRFTNSLKSNNLLKIKNIGHFNQQKIDTESQLLKSIGFMLEFNNFTADAYEVFLIECVNKHLNINDKFKSKSKWERRLSEDE